MNVFRSMTKNLTGVSTETIRDILRMSENGFEGVLQKVKIITCEKGNCLAEMKVEKDHINAFETLHGGLSATIVDSISSFALLTYDKSFMIPSVSVDLHMSYVKGAALGEEILIDAKTERAGKNLAYLKCEIRNKATGDLLAKGSHTKYFIRPKD